MIDGFQGKLILAGSRTHQAGQPPLSFDPEAVVKPLVQIGLEMAEAVRQGTDAGDRSRFDVSDVTALLDFARQYAKRRIEATGTAGPAVLYVSKFGQCVVYALPVMPSNHFEKNLLAELLSIPIIYGGVSSAILVVEAWFCASLGDVAADRVAPSQREDRKEAAFITVSLPGLQKTGIFEILRTPETLSLSDTSFFGSDGEGSASNALFENLFDIAEKVDRAMAASSQADPKSNVSNHSVH